MGRENPAGRSRPRRDDGAAALKHGKPRNPLQDRDEPEESGQPRQRTARKIDRDSAPEGYDATIWGLAVHFELKAEAEGWTLAAGRPVIYAALHRKLLSLGWLSNGVVRPVHLDLTRDLIDQFFADEIEHSRARYAIDQFTSLLADMAKAFIEEVRVSRAMRSAHDSEPTEQEIERGHDVRAARAAAVHDESGLTVDAETWPERPDWTAIRERAAGMKGAG